MNSRNRVVLAAVIVIVTTGIGLLYMGELPQQVATSFGQSGEVTDRVAKPIALGAIPVGQLLVIGVFAMLPRIDPLGENIREFRRAYDVFVLLLLAFLGYVHALLIFWNVGYEFLLIQALIPAVAVLVYGIGSVIEQAKQNWFVGIRTPWTLSDEQVWEDTHDLSGRLFKVAAVVTLGGVLFPEVAVGFIAVPVAVVAVIATVYSYWRYRQIGTVA